MADGLQEEIEKLKIKTEEDFKYDQKVAKYIFQQSKRRRKI